MKGIRFYLEYPNKTEKNKATVKAPGNHSGNVVAIYTDSHYVSHPKGQDAQIMVEGFSAVFFHPNSDVNFGSVSRDWLWERCKRVPESLAREIHPRLFARLDD